MRPTRDISLKSKLMLIIMLTSVVALLLASAAFVAYDWVTFRRTVVDDHAILAKIVGGNCAAAITFDDAKSAERTLASLKAEAHLMAACIFTPDNRVFASYVRSDLKGWVPPKPVPSGEFFVDDHLALYRPVIHNGEQIGTVYVQEDLLEMHQRLTRYASIGLVVLLMSLFAALLLSGWLQRLVSEPILQLAKTATEVSVDKDYEVRARKFSSASREVVTLIDAFNEMLAQIQSRDKALQDSEGHFRSLIENASDIITIIDLDSRIRYVSPSAKRLLDFAPDELIGKIALDYIHADDVKTVSEKLRQVAEAPEGIVSAEYRFRHKDGSWIYLESKTRNLLSDPSLAGIIVNSRDVTERKRAEQERREANSQLENALAELKSTQQQVVQQERLRALGQMASGIAHDFNNALAPILGFSELLLDQPEARDTPGTLREYLQIINTASRDAANTVSRLREFYRTRDEKEIMRAIDLQQLIKQVVSLTQPRWKNQAEMGGICIHVETDLRDVPPVLGNDADLREALTNLIFNAVDAMPQGGTVAITGYAEDGQVVLKVSDTGTGMTDEVRRRCLEPFFTTKGERGTGLGLSMVYGIVRRHAGMLDIQSEVGRGTTFVIRLPTQEKTAVANSGLTTKASISCPLRVLVVDDDPLVRNVEAKYLEAAGHSVMRAASGPEGLEKFRAEKFDVVVLDRAMPGMSGDQLASTVKELSADTPVIMLTGFGDLMDATGEKPPHVDVLLSKPITLVGLQEAVRKIAVEPKPCTV